MREQLQGPKEQKPKLQVDPTNNDGGWWAAYLYDQSEFFTHQGET